LFVQQAVPLDSLPFSAAFGPRIEGMTQRYAVGEYGGPIHVYTQPGGHETVLRGHVNTPSHLRFSADGCELVSSSMDGTVRRWRLEDSGAARCHGHEPRAGVGMAA
jgi:WD40 repeat protein